VLEGDVQGELDADRLAHLHVPVTQLNTDPGFGGECHLDANMVRSAIGALPLHEIDLLVIENVGNLVCPAEFRVGEAVTMGEGRDLTLVATGGCVGTALAVRDALRADGIAARVLNMHTLKPLDRAAIERAARETGRLLTIEEHSINGGLGGAVAEVLAELGTGRLARVGLRDVFATEVAPYPELLRIHGLDAAGVEAAARELLGRGSKAGRAGIPPAR